MIKQAKKQSGFTLIEALIYLALFGLLFTGVIICVYSVLESSDRNQAKALMQADANFIAAKINWALSGAQSISVPAQGNLQITTPSGPLEFKLDPLNNTDLLLSGVTLNNSNEKVTDLFFIKIDANGDKPQGLKYGFNLSSLTPSGASIYTDFASIIYLRK